MAAPSHRPGSELPSTRYELRRPLGEGAAGAVFLAFDRETGEEVALKKLFRVDQRGVQRFKREFRAIADLRHPNLVKLYELQRAQDGWFLTMEYVDGVDMRTELARELDTRMSSAVDAWNSPARISRIARAFHQLALGVQAVHRAGMLHRDLKPSNVVVARTGRVVVLDFGLVRELAESAITVTVDGTVAGTPAYMPPEQATGLELTPAADWYAFGAMLYEMLSGELPIDGRSAIDLLQRKLSSDPEPLGPELAPPALTELCMALLHRDPQQRPGGEAILSVLEQMSVQPREETASFITEESSLTTEAQALTPRAPLFGRDAETEQLHAAFERAHENLGAVVHVRGTSGSGKTSLIEHFLEVIQASKDLYDGQVIVLRSRCYEREAMPFKALDGAIDALVNHLGKLDDFTLAHMLPSGIHALTQVFPAFERLRVVQTLIASGRLARGDAAQIRRNAERALRELFTSVAERRRLVMWIDDLQWGDLDSANMIQDWLKRSVGAPILIVLSYRSDELETSSCLQQLVAAAAETGSALPRFELNLSPLADAEIEKLCAQRLSSSPAEASPVTARIVAESRGNPFLALQLTALARAKLERGEVDLDALSVGELVLRTSALLPEAARGLLNVLAVAGRPLLPQLALSAASVRREGRSHIHELQSLRLVRTRIVDGVRLLEVYHDRVREAIQASLSAAEHKAVHERLLRVLEMSGQADPAWLHTLALGAGQHMLALRHGQLAAKIASNSLAFERSAELYARCVTLTRAPDELVMLWNKLGLALARCRRGAQAADAYLKASEYAKDAERVQLLQLAASHLLRSGRYQEGEQLVQRVMDALRIELPSTRTGMYASIAWERLRFALLARTVTPQLGIPLPADELRRGEFYGMVAVWTAAYAPLRAALFQARTVRMAFQYGETNQMARTMCLTAAISCLSGTSAAANRAEEQLKLAEEWAKEANHPNVHVEILSARAACALLLGRLRDAIAPSYAADEIYDKKSAFDDTGDYYHVFAIRTVRVGALQGLGRHIEAIRDLRELIAHAQATDNLTTILQISACVTTMEQVLEQCAGSRQRLDWERARLPTGETGILHVMHMTAVLRAAAITCDFDWAQGVVDELWPGYERSPVRHSSYLSFVLRVNLTRLVLNRHVLRGEPGDPRAAVRKHLRWLSNAAPAPLRKPSRARIEARLAYLRGDRARAIEHFRESLGYHEQIDAADDVARERYALAASIGGSDAIAAKRTALEALSACGVADPEADLRAYYPELFREAAKAVLALPPGG